MLDDLSNSRMQSSPAIDEEHCNLNEKNEKKFKPFQKFFHILSNGELEIKYKWRDENKSERVHRRRGMQLNKVVYYLLETIFPEANESSYQSVIDNAISTNDTSNSNLVLQKIREAYQMT